MEFVCVFEQVGKIEQWNIYFDIGCREQSEVEKGNRRLLVYLPLLPGSDEYGDETFQSSRQNAFGFGQRSKSAIFRCQKFSYLFIFYLSLNFLGTMVYVEKNPFVLAS